MWRLARTHQSVKYGRFKRTWPLYYSQCVILCHNASFIVQETPNTLQLCPIIPEFWFAETPQIIETIQANTIFGNIDFKCTLSKIGASIQLATHFHTKPDSFYIDFKRPYKQVFIDGKPITFGESRILISKETRQLEIEFQ